MDIIGELAHILSTHTFIRRLFVSLLGVALSVFWSSCATRPEQRPDTPEDASFVEGLEDTPYESISLYMSLGDPEAAIAAYEDARLRDPEDPDTLVLLAALQMTAGLVEDAELTLEEAL
ncbi:MAG: tetratricopeptide repeat protein, partial [Spirochaetota bacterium]